MRTRTFTIGVLALLALALAPIGSAGDDGFYTPVAPPVHGTLTPTGQPGSVNKGRAGIAPGKAFTGKKCTSVGKSRTCFYYKSGKLTKRCFFKGKRSTCTYYNKTGHAYKRCTWKRPGAKPTCRKIKRARLTALGAHQFAAFATHAATLPGKRAHMPESAHGIIGEGFDQTMAAVGAILLNGQGHCTGTLVARGIAVTAAHCVYKNGYLSPSALTFAPGQSAYVDYAHIATQPYGEWQVLDTYAMPEYQNGDTGRDWAFLLLGADGNGYYPGDYTGSWSMYQNVNPIGHGYLVGYTNEGIFSTYDYYYGNAQYSTNVTWDSEISTVGSNYLIWWRSSMSGGASGGPVFEEDSSGNWGVGGVIHGGITHQCPDNSCRGTPGLLYWSDYTNAPYFDSGIANFWQLMRQAWG